MNSPCRNARRANRNQHALSLRPLFPLQSHSLFWLRPQSELTCALWPTRYHRD